MTELPTCIECRGPCDMMEIDMATGATSLVCPACTKDADGTVRIRMDGEVTSLARTYAALGGAPIIDPRRGQLCP